MKREEFVKQFNTEELFYWEYLYKGNWHLDTVRKKESEVIEYYKDYDEYRKLDIKPIKD